MATDFYFRMTVADVFYIKGRGTVVTGQIEAGTLKTGDEIYLQGSGLARKVTVSGIEMFRKILSEAAAGDNVGVLLRGVEKKDVKPGDVLTGSPAA